MNSRHRQMEVEMDKDDFPIPNELITIDQANLLRRPLLQTHDIVGK